MSEPKAASETPSVWSSIDALTRGIADRRFTAQAVVEGVLARIEAVDPQLRAYASLWPDRARARAAELDSLPHERRGPLHGVPIAVKDLCDVRGQPTRAGSLALGDETAMRDATVVARLEAAGAVILGKLKMTEGAYTSHHPGIEPPRNPFSAARWTGISSSGSGVAVAGGLCTAALGTDTGGSIRFPSAACGVVGLKPTHGRVSLAGVFPLAPSLDHVGPMARNVDDVERLFRVLARPDPRDPTSLHDPLEAHTGSSGVAGLRIGFDPDYCEDGVDPEVRAAVARAFAALLDAGAVERSIRMPSVDSVFAAWMPICGAEAANAHAHAYPARAELYGPDLARLIDFGRATTGQALATAWGQRIAYTRRLAPVFADCDVIVCPALAKRWPATANLGAATPPEGAFTAMRFTLPFNLSGHPSLTLPVGLDGDGAPLAVQLVGRALHEAELLTLGRALEARRVGLDGYLDAPRA